MPPEFRSLHNVWNNRATIVLRRGPRRSLGKLILVASSAMLLSLPGTPAAAQEPPTLAQIVDGLERQERLLFESESLRIRYERTTTTDLIQNQASGGFLLQEWTLAYRGDRWLAEMRFTQPTKTKGLYVPAEPRTQVIRDRLLLEWRQYAHTAVIGPFDTGGNAYSGLHYTRNLSLNAAKYMARSGGGDFAAIRRIPHYGDDLDLPFLPEFLRENMARYEVLPVPEEVDGVPCWVVH